MINHDTPKLAVVKDGNKGCNTIYEMSGLLRGIGDGYASALRMYLLEYIPGLKPIGFKMTGVSTELDRVSMKREPMIDVTRNIEQIIVKAKEGMPCEALYTIKIDKQVNGEVKLKDFELGNLEALNPELTIITTTEPQHLTMSIIIMLGTGYLKSSTPIQQYKNLGSDLVRVNSNFSPVTFVNFTTIENKPIEGKETVLLEVRTNGSIQTKVAVSLASTIMSNYLQPLTMLSQLNWDTIPKSTISKKVTDEYDLPIEYFKLTPEEFNHLKDKGAISVRDLKNSEHKYDSDIIKQVYEQLKEMKLTDIEKTE